MSACEPSFSGGRTRSIVLPVEETRLALCDPGAAEAFVEGELSSIAFAGRVQLAVQTDHQGARKLAAMALAAERVQTTPHVLGWLFFEGRLVDGDLNEIVAEHESFDRPLRRFFEEMYQEALRCRLLLRDASTSSNGG